MEIKDVVPVLELVKQRNSELFVIASEISEKALSSLLFNHIKGIIKVISLLPFFQICAITVPGFGSHTAEILEDFAILTGATLVENFEKVTIEELGRREIVSKAIREGGEG
jgi:chaperonin GroEL